MIMNNSVFVRDTPHNLFLYGTTDIIVGTVSGRNMVINTDFNQRGEFSGGPDGCALDFETSATGQLGYCHVPISDRTTPPSTSLLLPFVFSVFSLQTASHSVLVLLILAKPLPQYTLAMACRV
eukprot:TRINITY_DN12170_c0_g1_i4.p4 TRINITY_DN12170_c0_g1~~TRINITY_DN12170_c0_g1_i4.p4  ORF type:complete len:123 (+),score=8.69 TRINITY_DN12170_c0_g1_i4:998-1366(+)